MYNYTPLHLHVIPYHEFDDCHLRLITVEPELTPWEILFYSSRHDKLTSRKWEWVVLEK